MSALLRWISFRHLVHEGWRSALTLLGVALGVSVFVSIRLASHSALASFSDTVDSVAGRANLQVTGSTEGFDERLFPELRALPGVSAAAPVMERHARVRPGPRAVAGEGAWETLLVLGVDLFHEAPFARWEPERGVDRGRALALLTHPRGVAITATWAARAGLARGDTVTVLASGRPVALEVVQVIASSGFQQASGGNVAVLDVAAFQEVFGRPGRLDRVDLLVPPSRRDEVARTIAARLPPGLEVNSPAGRTRQVESMVRAFDLNLTALSFIALFVAVFLIFNAVSMAVLKRRREIGILRAVGVTRGQVARLFVLEGLFLGGLGGALGVALGTLLAQGTLGMVSRTLSDLYLVAHAARLRPDAGIAAAGVALGVASALAAAVGPALEAAHLPPGVTLRQGMQLEARGFRTGRIAAAGAGLLAIAGLVSWWTVAAHRPLGGFASAFLVLAGFSLLAPAWTRALERAAEPPARRFGGIEAVLGLRSLRESLARASVVVAALMVSVGMTVALTIMVGSFRRTVDVWIGQTIRGDLYVEPIDHREGGSATRLAPALLERIAALPGVAAMDTYRASRVRHAGRTVFVVGLDFEVQRRHGGLQLVRGRSDAALARARARDGVLVSESFARHHRAEPGDTLALETPSGTARLPVEAVFYDYSSDAGAVMMDQGLYARLMRDERVESFALYLEPGTPPGPVQAGVAAAAGDTLLLRVMPNRTLRERVLVVFDQTFQITWALQTIAIVVAVLGVIGTLTALVTQRGREIGVLRATGATRRQVRRMVLIESAVLGAAGALLGCVTGWVLALLLIHVINQEFFGWTIRTSVDPRVFVQAIALMVATAMLAGLAPARLAAGRLPAEAMRAD